MENTYSQKTVELLQSVRQLRTYINESLPSQLVGQDIESQNSQYRQNEDTLKSALERLVLCLDLIESQQDSIDNLPYNFKTNLHNLVSPIVSWMQSGVLGNYPSIMSHTESLYTTLFQYGIAPSVIDKDSVKTFFSSLKEVRQDLGDMKDLRVLKKELSEIKQASNSIPIAQALLDTINNNKKISEASKFADELSAFEDEFRDKAEIIRKLHDKETLDALDSNFKEQSRYHRKLANKWLGALIFGVIFFAFSALYVILLSVGLDSNFSLGIPSILEVNRVLLIGFSLLTLAVLVKKFPKNLTKHELINFITTISTILVIIGFLNQGVNVVFPSIEKLSFELTAMGIVSNLLVRTVILAPSAIVLIYSSKAYGRNIQLAEDYEYKFIASTTFDTVIKKAESITHNFSSQAVVDLVLSGIYTRTPGEKVPGATNELGSISMDKFLNSSVISKFIDVASKLKS